MDQESLSLHPLRARRKPGPKRADSAPPGEVDLENASKLLKLVESGKLARHGPPIPVAIPTNSAGRPLRRLRSEEERELAYRVQTYGDLEARNTLVLANMGLVHLVAKQQRQKELRYEDLVQEGFLGLLRATETFDPGRGVRFSTYCVYWIRARLQRLAQKLDRDEIPLIHGQKCRADDRSSPPARAHKISLAMPIEHGESHKEFGDTLAGNLDSPEQTALNRERSNAVLQALVGISRELADHRLMLIINQRLLSDNPQTLSVIGEKLNLSREGARLLERKILHLAKQRLAIFR